nr:hypothetical protein [Propionibacterium sp.]
MSIPSAVTLLLGLLTPTRAERGLSQSTENVILLVGAVAVAGAVIALVLNYVQTALVLNPW